jgi:hypothetical protein
MLWSLNLFRRRVLSCHRLGEGDMKALDIGQLEEVQTEFVRLLLLAETMSAGPEREIMQQLLYHSRRALDQSHQLAKLREGASQDTHTPPPAERLDASSLD